MKRGLLIAGIGITVACIGFFALRLALRDRASGPNISVIETDNCSGEEEKWWNKPALSVSSQQWKGGILILEVDQVDNCGGHGRLSAPSYNLDGNALCVSWHRIFDPSKPVTACRCAWRLRFELSGLERKEYAVKLALVTRLKWNGKFYDNFNDYLKDREKTK